jgi:hypothetical protein
LFGCPAAAVQRWLVGWLVGWLVEMVVGGNYDTVLAARKEYKMCWGKNGEKYARIDNGVMPTAFKDPIYISLLGLGCVTHPHLIYEEEKLGQKVGILEVDNPYSPIEVKCDETASFAEKIMDSWENHVASQAGKFKT